MSILSELVNAGFIIEAGREERSQDLKNKVNIVDRDDSKVLGRIVGFTVTLHPSSIEKEKMAACTCPDWENRGRVEGTLCKHILAVCHAVDETNTNFPAMVKSNIATAVAKIAMEVKAILNANDTPYLIGPTGCGKTSAVRLCTVQEKYRFVEVSGSDSWADADLVGIDTGPQGIKRAGPWSQACEMVRQGETVLVFLDEFPRFNQRAQDILMRPLLPIAPDVASAMGITTTEDVRVIEIPLWDREWAPVSRLKVALAGNPWGNPIDAALIRRMEPVEVDFDSAVIAAFDRPIRESIEFSWRAVKSGQIPLPVEYQLISRAQSPTDAKFMAQYMKKLRAVDRAAADGFQKAAKGLGLDIN